MATMENDQNMPLEVVIDMTRSEVERQEPGLTAGIEDRLASIRRSRKIWVLGHANAAIAAEVTKMVISIATQGWATAATNSASAFSNILRIIDRVVDAEFEEEEKRLREAAAALMAQRAAPAGAEQQNVTALMEEEESS